MKFYFIHGFVSVVDSSLSNINIEKWKVDNGGCLYKVPTRVISSGSLQAQISDSYRLKKCGCRN